MTEIEITTGADVAKILQDQPGYSEKPLPPEITIDIKKDEKGLFLCALNRGEEVERRYLSNIECQIFDFEPWVIDGIPTTQQKILLEANKFMEDVQAALLKGQHLSPQTERDVRTTLRRDKKRRELIQSDEFQLPSEVPQGNRKARRAMKRIQLKLQKSKSPKVFDGLDFPIMKGRRVVGHVIEMSKDENGELQGAIKLRSGDIIRGAINEKGQLKRMGKDEEITPQSGSAPQEVEEA